MIQYWLDVIHTPELRIRHDLRHELLNAILTQGIPKHELEFL